VKGSAPLMDALVAAESAVESVKMGNAKRSNAGARRRAKRDARPSTLLSEEVEVEAQVFIDHSVGDDAAGVATSTTDPEGATREDRLLAKKAARKARKAEEKAKQTCSSEQVSESPLVNPDAEPIAYVDDAFVFEAPLAMEPLEILNPCTAAFVASPAVERQISDHHSPQTSESDVAETDNNASELLTKLADDKSCGQSALADEETCQDQDVKIVADDHQLISCSPEDTIYESSDEVRGSEEISTSCSEMQQTGFEDDYASEDGLGMHTKWREPSRQLKHHSRQYVERQEDGWMTSFEELQTFQCAMATQEAVPHETPEPVVVYLDAEQSFTDGQQVFSPITGDDGQQLYTDGVQVYAMACVAIDDVPPTPSGGDSIVLPCIETPCFSASVTDCFADLDEDETWNACWDFVPNGAW
jgi:hypothetical protein